MITFRPIMLALAVMAVFLTASLLYAYPRRPPDEDRAKYDFLRTHRDCSVVSVELETIEEDVMKFRIRYRGFASNLKQEEVYAYRQKRGKGWQLEL